MTIKKKPATPKPRGSLGRYEKRAVQAMPAATPPENVPRLDLVRDQDYQKANDHIFCSLTSLRHFVKKYREKLTADGAIKLVTDRLFIVPERFAATVDAVGGEAMARSRERFSGKVRAAA